jgi:hypothetical protein
MHVQADNRDSSPGAHTSAHRAWSPGSSNGTPRRSSSKPTHGFSAMPEHRPGCVRADGPLSAGGSGRPRLKVPSVEPGAGSGAGCFHDSTA